MIYASERGLGGGAKFRTLYQKLLMGKIGVFITVLSKLWQWRNFVKILGGGGKDGINYLKSSGNDNEMKTEPHNTKKG